MTGDEERSQRQRVASMLELGPEGLLAIYDLTPEQALDSAVETLTSMQIAKNSLAWVDEMALVAKVTAAAEATPGHDVESPSTRAFLAGHAKLVEKLEVIVSGGGSLLLAYLSRAGGHELSDEERFEMKRAFDAVDREVERRRDDASEASSE
jgi:hypothetical protein